MLMRRSLSSWATSAAATIAGLAAAGCAGSVEPTAIAIEQPDGSLTLLAGTFDRSCSDTSAPVLECGRWELRVTVEPEAQDPGPKPLLSPYTWAENVMSDGKIGGSQCLVVGGSFEKGTVEITATTAATVSYTLEGTTDGAFNADGSYDAVRCK
jgi:hypothetical protein